MKAQKRLLTLFINLFVIFCVTGCTMDFGSRPETAGETKAEQLDIEEDMETLQSGLESFVGEIEYEQNFVKPHVYNNIYIDTQGYDTQDVKQAYFVGNDLSQDFFVYRSDNGKLVFTGKMVQTENDALGDKSVYKGDFSELTQPGTYYVQTAVIGRSYDFVIEDNHYNNLLGQLRQSFLDVEPEEYYDMEQTERMDACLYGFLQMCISYQLSPDYFDEAMQKRLCEHAQWLLTWKEEADRRKDQYPVEEYYLLSACFSQFAAAIQKQDAQLYNTCLRMSQKTYNQVTQVMLAQGDYETAQYMAAASLYKAGGNAVFHNTLKKIYNNKREKAGTVSANDADTEQTQEDSLQRERRLAYMDYQEFVAVYSYMTTERTVDLKICEQMMSDFINDCAQLLSRASGSAYGLTTGKRWAAGIQGADNLQPESDWHLLREKVILLQAVQLAVADYTIVGREYRNVCRQQIHYVLHDTDPAGLGEDSRSAVWLILCIIMESEETQ